MHIRKLLRLIRILRLDRLHDLPVFIVGSPASRIGGESLLSHTQHILMIITQGMFQHLGITGFIENIMETVVQLRHLIHVSFRGMELRQIYILLHLLHLFLCDLLSCQPGT